MVTTLTRPPIASGPATNVRGAHLRMFGNEISKGLRVMWVHKIPLITMLVLMAGSYWFYQLFIGGGSLVPGLMAMTVAGYLAYVVAYIALLRMAAGLLEDMFTGTLEQSLLSPLPPWVQSTGRLAAAMVESLAVAAVVAIVFLIPFAGIGVDLTFSWSVLIPVVVTVVDIAGFAMFIGGVALVVNSIGSIVHVIQGFILFLNGGFIPIFVFPEWLETATKFVPTALGVDAIRRLTTTTDTLGDVWADGTLPLAIVHAAALLILGWTFYQAAIRRGLREGRLGA
jgi:ABC-2 type transport system permease protein